MTQKQGLSFDLGIPSTPDFVTDPLQASEFQRIYNSLNNLAFAMDAATGRNISTLSYQQQTQQTVGQSFRLQNQDVFYAVANVNTPAGAPCCTRLSGTVYTAFLSQAVWTGSPPNAPFATCICVTDGGVVAGQVGAFCFSGGITPFVGSIAEGFTYYLSSTTPGGIVDAPPTAAGTFVQPLGFALDLGRFYAKISNPILFN